MKSTKQSYKALNLGSGDQRMPAAVNVDMRPSTGAEVIHDLNELPWPFSDEEFDCVYALDILEHLDSVVDTLEEIHRILKPGGVAEIRYPHWQSENSWIDPTHKWHLHERSLNYFDPTTEIGKKYGYYSECKFKILDNLRSGQEIIVKMEKTAKGKED